MSCTARQPTPPWALAKSTTSRSPATGRPSCRLALTATFTNRKGLLSMKKRVTPDVVLAMLALFVAWQDLQTRHRCSPDEGQATHRTELDRLAESRASGEFNCERDDVDRRRDGSTSWRGLTRHHLIDLPAGSTDTSAAASLSNGRSFTGPSPTGSAHKQWCLRGRQRCATPATWDHHQVTPGRAGSGTTPTARRVRWLYFRGSALDDTSRYTNAPSAGWRGRQDRARRSPPLPAAGRTLRRTGLAEASQLQQIE